MFVDFGVQVDEFGIFEFDENYVFLPVSVSLSSNIVITLLDKDAYERASQKRFSNTVKFDVQGSFQQLKANSLYYPSNPLKIDASLSFQHWNKTTISALNSFGIGLFKDNSNTIKFIKVASDDNISEYLNKKLPAFYSMGHFQKLFSRPDLHSNSISRRSDFTKITMFLLNSLQYPIPCPLFQNPDPHTNIGRFVIQYYNDHAIHKFSHTKNVICNGDVIQLCMVHLRQTFRIDVDSDEQMKIVLIDKSLTNPKQDIKNAKSTPYFTNGQDELCISRPFIRQVTITSILENSPLYLVRDISTPVHVFIRSNQQITEPKKCEKGE